MHYTHSHRNLVLTIVASVMIITASYAVFGWSDPDGAPPESSIPIPLDTGDADQTKIGALKVKSLTTTGAVGVGIDAPAKPLDVLGDIHASGDVCTDAGGGKCLSALTAGGNRYSMDAADGDPLNALSIDNDGKVGIGKTTPGYLLDVNGIVNATEIYKNGASFTIDNPWNKAGTDINYTAGKVGIGTTAPSYKLEVSTTNNVDGIKISGVGNNFAVINTDTVDGADKKTLRLLPYGSDSVANTRGASVILQGNEATGGGDVLIQPGSTGDILVSSGKVGIGTTAPSQLLHVYNSTDVAGDPSLAQVAYFQRKGSNAVLGLGEAVSLDLGFNWGAGATNFVTSRIASRTHGSSWGSALEFYTSNNNGTSGGNLQTRVIIDNAGKVGIGTTTPTSLLHVFGGSGIAQQNDTGKARSVIADGKFYPNRDGSQYYYLSVDTLSIGWSSGGKITTAQGGKGKLTIDPDDTADVIIQPTSGNVGIGTTSPQSALHIPDGKYLQAEDNNAGAPPSADCDSDAERGRISLDTTNFRLYICAGSARGWDFAELSD